MTHHPASTAALGAEGRCGHTLDVSALSEADQYRFILNKVRFAERLCGFGRDSCTTVITIFFGEIAHIILNQRENLLGMSKQILEAGDLLCDMFMLFFDLPAFEGSQPA